MARRVLTPEEIDDIRGARLDEERARYPNFQIIVHVEDETDDNGSPRVIVEKISVPPVYKSLRSSFLDHPEGGRSVARASATPTTPTAARVSRW